MTGQKMVNPEWERALDDARANGQARLIRWTQDGTLLPSADLARAWDMQGDEIKAAVQRGEFFEVWVGYEYYVPSELIPLGSQLSFEICSHLGKVTSTEKLIFFLRKHGGLQGKTVVEAIKTGEPLERILLLAENWALA